MFVLARAFPQPLESCVNTAMASQPTVSFRGREIGIPQMTIPMAFALVISATKGALLVLI